MLDEKANPTYAAPELDALADAAARFAADLYFFVARQVIEELGEAGEQALRRGLREFGLARGAAIRAAVEAAGEEANLASFLRHYNLPTSRAWRSESTVRPERKEATITYCPFAEQWRARGGTREGQLYCEEVDPAIRAGFGPEVRFTAPRFTLRDGGPCQQSDEGQAPL